VPTAWAINTSSLLVGMLVVARDQPPYAMEVDLTRRATFASARCQFTRQVHSSSLREAPTPMSGVKVKRAWHREGPVVVIFFFLQVQEEQPVAWLFRQTISNGGRSGNALAREARESMEAGPGALDRALHAA
jgi:hypothetical protein